MLTERMQIQVIADRLAGLPVNVDVRFMTQPWLTCWNAIVSAPRGSEQEVLFKATINLPEQKEILQAILATRYVPHVPSLEDIASILPPIEWVWKGWIPRGLITVLGASQGSGKSFVAMDLAYRIIHNIGFPDGTPIVRPGANVIYVDAEGVPQILRERANHYGMDQNKIFLMLADPGEMIDLGQQKYQDRLTEMAATLKPELIIIDSLSSIHSRGQEQCGRLARIGGVSHSSGGLGELRFGAGASHPQTAQRRRPHDELRPGHGRPERLRLYHAASARGIGFARGADRTGVRSEWSA